ncbi:hypothetical protein O3P69_003090 [Scylla paramamosain]|uniref:EGF-like domain-containing protein n=1 Tax=Scylla paramamosain TaxID=85552 RepID=A0AAW0ULQ1_SCYPA
MELLVCQPRGAPFLLLGLALLCGQVRSECERRIPNCVGENCVEKVECLNGRCGVDGACECLPCYSGPTCAAYDDKYGPRFAIRLDTVIVNSKHEGVVYKASAEDEDLGLTCPLGPGQHTRCPCAAITYSLLVPPDTLNHPLFTIHESSGQVFLREGSRLTPGSSHQLEIIASSTKNSLLYDYQTLTILVHREDHLDELLHEGSTVRLLDEDTEALKADAFNTSQFLFFEDTLGGGNDNEELESLDRRKRYAVADENDFANLDISINRNTILQDATAKLGIEIEYGVTILLPKD